MLVGHGALPSQDQARPFQDTRAAVDGCLDSRGGAAISENAAAIDTRPRISQCRHDMAAESSPEGATATTEAGGVNPCRQNKMKGKCSVGIIWLQLHRADNVFVAQL